jgi:hypothetical protein
MSPNLLYHPKDTPWHETNITQATIKINRITLRSDYIHCNRPSNLACERRLDNIYEFSPYLKENTTHHRYKDQPVNTV